MIVAVCPETKLPAVTSATLLVNGNVSYTFEASFGFSVTGL